MSMIVLLGEKQFIDRGGKILAEGKLYLIRVWCLEQKKGPVKYCSTGPEGY